MKALIKDYIVVDMSENAFEVHPSFLWIDAPEGCKIGWILNPESKIITPPEPKALELNDFYMSLRQLFDDVAKQKDYDDAMSIVSYYASTNSLWAQESQTFVAWRDNCWSVALQILDEVQTGTRSAPSIADFLNELPIIQWS